VRFNFDFQKKKKYYYNPLKQRKVLNDVELVAIFMNINQIIEINTKFQKYNFIKLLNSVFISFSLSALLSRIEECKKQKKINVAIGDILLEHVINCCC
jgi:hypothetical protein